MTILDAVTIGAIAICAVFGAASGLIWELSHLGALLCGFIAAECLHDTVAEIFFYRLGGTGAQVVAYVVVFVAVAACIFIIAHYLKKAVDSAGLKVADQIAGFLFGVLQGAIIVSVTLFVLAYFTGTVSRDYVERSSVASYVMRKTGSLVSFIPKGCYEKARTFLVKESPRAVEGLNSLKRKVTGEQKPESRQPIEGKITPQPTADAAQQK